MSLYYFFDRCGGRNLWVAAGLSERFAREPACCEVGGELGPDGLSGTIFCESVGPNIPRGIAWHAALGPDGQRPAYWVGVHPSRRPTPAELQRSDRTIRGYGVTLRDGNEWIIPLVLPAEGNTCGLPAEACVRNGQVVFDPVATFAPLIEHGQRYLDAFESGHPQSDCWPYVVELLAVGHRVGADEILALGLIDRDAAAACVLASIDARARVEQAAGLELATAE